MRHLPRRLILTLCALLLLGAQQAAYTHLIGHLAPAAPVVAQPADASGDAVALSLSHLCTSCLAISALAAGAPLPVSLPAVADAVVGSSADVSLLRLTVATALPYAARAPPQSL